MSDAPAPDNLTTRMLATVERVGNKLPDPAMLFVGLLVIVWALSWLFSMVTFEVLDPRSGEPLVVNNLVTGPAMTEWLSVMVTNFAHFHPVGVVLVAMLGIGVAEHTGFINTGLRALLGVTAKWLLTPMVIVVGIVSHTAVDAGYVLVIPLGGVIFYAAGRHPLAGIAAAFAGGGPSPRIADSTRTATLSAMLHGGMYEVSGEWAATVGLPAKSGVSGAVWCSIPGVGGLCAQQARIDDAGNSVAAMELLRSMVKTLPELSVFSA